MRKSDLSSLSCQVRDIVHREGERSMTFQKKPRKPKFKPTSDSDHQMSNLYLSGIGMVSIARQFDCSNECVRNRLKIQGITMRPQALSLDKTIIINMYNSGLSPTKIGKQLQCCHKVICKILRKNGITIQRQRNSYAKYHDNEDFFRAIDTEEKAYFLGLMYADGCNVEKNKNGKSCVSIGLLATDGHILEKFRDLIAPERSLDLRSERIDLRKNGKFSKSRARKVLRITNRIISKQLANLGCTQRKTFTLTFPTWLTDPELQRHFIRGYFDGDGCISRIQYPTQYAARYGYTWSIVSTLMFCQTVHNIIQINTSINTFFTHKGKGIYALGCGGNKQVKSLYDWLYKDATIYLERKYQKYLEFCEYYNLYSREAQQKRKMVA